MPFPADFTVWQQYRMKHADMELQSAARDFMRSLERLENARTQFIAQGLTSLWPAAGTDFVHRDDVASTRDEQNDLSTAILHALAQIKNQGTSATTPAQAAVIWQRYQAV